jgi:hypothetical protein
MLGLQILYSSDYRLTNFAHAATQLQAVPESATAQSAVTEPSPFDAEVSTTSSKPRGDPLTAASRKRHRIAVAILLVGTAIVNTGAWTYKQTEQKRSLEEVVANGGALEMVDGKPIRITFGPSTTESDLQRMPSIPSVKSISLAGTKVTNVGLFNKFRSLESMDIRDTKFDPQNLYMVPGNRSIEIVVSEGQYVASDLQVFTSRGFSIREIAD